MIEEEWRPIPGYEGRWEASSLGQIRSLPRRRTKGGVLRQYVNKRGYPSLTLGRDKWETHRLIALAFIGPRPDGMEVRHLDGDRLNPVAANLAYGTRKENRQDALLHGTDHNARKTHCPQGHPYDESNTLRIPSRPSYRYCRTCNEAMKRAVSRRPRRLVPDFDPGWKP